MNNIVNEILKEIIQKSIITETDSPIQAKEDEEIPPIKFPSWFINENLWGKEVDTGPGSSDRKLITMVGGALSGENTPLGRVKAMQKFLTETATIKSEGITAQQVLANLMFLDIFASIVNQFNAAVAGFLFEALFAGIFKGEQIEAKAGGGEMGTKDVDLTIDTGVVGYSFKLLSEGVLIKGSFSDLVNGMLAEPEERYLVVIKEGESPSITLTFYEFVINQETWMTWIGPPSKIITKQDSEEVQFTVADLAEHGDKPVLVGGKPTGNTLKDYVLQAEDGSHYIASSSKRKGSPIHVNNLEGDRLSWSTKARGNTTLDPNQTYAFETTTGERQVAHYDKGSKGGSLYKDFLPNGVNHEWFKEQTGEYFESYVANGTYKNDPNFFKLLTAEGALGSYRAESPKGEVNEAKEEKQKAGQFAITQKYMISNPATTGGAGYELTLDRGLLNQAAKDYTEIISQQVFDIFNSLSDLIKDINTFYLSSDNNERKSSGVKAGDDAEKLKANTDKYIVSSFDEEAWFKSDPPLEAEPGPYKMQENKAKQPIDLDKLIEQMINKKFK